MRKILATAAAVAFALTTGATANATEIKPRPISKPQPGPARPYSTVTYKITRACSGDGAGPCVWLGKSAKGSTTRVTLLGDARYAVILKPRVKVSKSSPLIVREYRIGGKPYGVKVTHGRTVLARNAAVRSF